MQETNKNGSNDKAKNPGQGFRQFFNRPKGS